MKQDTRKWQDRQVRRRARRQQKRQERRQKRQQWHATQATTAAAAPKPAPQATAHLLAGFWDRFGFSAVLEGFGQLKHKGLALATLFLILLAFGLVNATSDSDLCAKVRAEPLFGELCAAELLDKQQLYRARKRLSGAEYDAWLGHMLGELQKDPRTASRPDGVLIGDDTVMLKTGRHMPDITVVYKSGEARYGWGYALPTVHYADADKDYPVGAKLHKRSAAQQQERADRQLRRKNGWDRRRPADEQAWLSELVAADRRPEVVILRGSRLVPGMTRHCETLQVPWVGVSPTNRQYSDAQGRAQAAKAWLQRPVAAAQWQILNDEGVRVAYLGPAQAATLGAVVLLVVEQVDLNERHLYVAPAATTAAQGVALVQAALGAEQPAPDNSKLHDMVELLQRAQAWIRAETATFDRWFYVAWFIQAVLALGVQRVVIKARADRLYTVAGQEEAKNWLDWQDQLPAYERHTVLGQPVELARLRVQDPDLGPVQLVYVREIRRRRRNGHWVEEAAKPYALMCTDPRWAVDKVCQAYKLRWTVEEFYREARQNHGLDRFHSRHPEAIHGHIVLAFLSYICVALARLWCDRLKDQTLGWIKRHLFQALVELKHQGAHLLVGFAPEWMQEYGLPEFCQPYVPSECGP
jgi:hypothetical protein